MFHYLSNSKALVQSVQRFVPWVESNDDIIRLLDRYLLFPTLSDTEDIVITGEFFTLTSKYLELDEYTEFLFDYARVKSENYPFEGTVQELYAASYKRSGLSYIGSALYHAGSPPSLIEKAISTKRARSFGVNQKVALDDTSLFTKTKAGFNYLIDCYTCGGYRLTYGDASPGPHMFRRSYITNQCTTFNSAYELFDKDPHAAWGMVQCGNTDPEVLAISNTIEDPLLHQKSRIIAETIAIIELGTEETDFQKKHSVTLKIGFGYGHSHNDFLDLNIFSHGLPMAVDIGQRDQGSLWTYPSNRWSYHHNHAFAHELTGDNNDDNNPKYAGTTSGSPWLTSFGIQSMKGKYLAKYDAFKTSREVVVMEIEDGENIYVFDVQRVKGLSIHTWNFHGTESDDLDINIPMSPTTDRWVNRHLEGTRMKGIGIDKISATWQMSRQKNTYHHTYGGGSGGDVTTVETEKVLLGSNYDESKPRINIKATLLGHANDIVYSGYCYSEYYEFAFPMLFVQSSGHSNDDVSIYPAIYEVFRGSSNIKDISYSSLSPLAVTVRTNNNQIDKYYSDDTYLKVISRNSNGDIRFVKLNGDTQFSSTDYSITTPKEFHKATIVSVDFKKRIIHLDQTMPANPAVVLSNEKRSLHIRLFGNRGTVFTYEDDLLISNGEIIRFENRKSGEIEILTTQGVTTDQFVFKTGYGNRAWGAFTFTNEAGTVQIRDRKIIKPEGATELTDEMFFDENGDGLISLNAYDIGFGYNVTLTPEITIKKFGNNYKIKTNVEVSGNIHGISFSKSESDEWLDI